jgi:outer membrane lipoprotein-sorting protein
MNIIPTFRTGLFLLLLAVTSTLWAQEDPKTIFSRAVDQVLTNQMELSVHISTTESNGRTIEKAYDILMGRFGEEDMMRMVMQEPERARGVTIVITKTPEESGVIEVFTPSNGKVRKMKATPENLERVGSSYILSDYSSKASDDMQFTLEGEEEVEGNPCYILNANKEENEKGMKARFIIEKNNYRIREIQVLDEEGNPTSVTRLSEYRPVEGLQGKMQPTHILTENLKEKTVKEMQITKVTYRPDLKREEFILEQVTK